MAGRKNQLAQNIPEKSTLNDIEREETTFEQANAKVNAKWQREEDYIPHTKQATWPLRIGQRKLRCEHFSGLLPETTGISRKTGKEYTLPPRYDLQFIDIENNDRMTVTIKADNADTLDQWKRNVNTRFDGKCYQKFNEGISPECAADIETFAVGSFARYMREHTLIIRYDFKSWTDHSGEYHESTKPSLYWYDPDKDKVEKAWLW